jgi:hypothetical protein
LIAAQHVPVAHTEQRQIVVTWVVLLLPDGGTRNSS